MEKSYKKQQINLSLCFLGHAEVVRVLLEANANVEDHNENGHTPLMEAASAGHVEVAKILLEYGAGINTHSNEVSSTSFLRKLIV